MTDFTRGDDPIYNEFRENWAQQEKEELQSRIDELESQLEALQEKAERDKGCDHCQHGIEIAYQAKSEHFDSPEAYICLDGNILEADLFTDYMAAKINYCPMCGKRLEVEHE